MKLLNIYLMAGLFLAACGTGPIYPDVDWLNDWVKLPGALDKTSDKTPVISDPVVNFHLAPGDRTSIIQAGEEWRAGETYLLGFDVRLDPKFLGKEKITLSRLTRKGNPSVEIAVVKLDLEFGVTVFGRSCIPAADLSKWHRVEMRIKFSDEDKGYLEVFCDRKPIWAQVDMRTNFAPECRYSEGCRKPVPKPERYKWQLGLMTDVPVSQMINLQMQRLNHRRLYYKPNRVGTL